MQHVKKYREDYFSTSHTFQPSHVSLNPHTLNPPAILKPGKGTEITILNPKHCTRKGQKSQFSTCSEKQHTIQNHFQ